MDEIPLKEEPPSNQAIMDSGARGIFTSSFVAKRLKGVRAIWESDWDFCPIRNSLYSRCLALFTDISKEEIGGDNESS